ncbi:hypothetical protein [Streptomyces roseifaciens]|uniref:hypothetical protein n=1 Tax=Streptomyces roseifaciens TaxID=1488406 RepID=UPI0007180AB4|nr:hypothetical protein [Streptomyces roseifaciens]
MSKSTLRAAGDDPALRGLTPVLVDRGGDEGCLAAHEPTPGPRLQVRPLVLAESVDAGHGIGGHDVAAVLVRLLRARDEGLRDQAADRLAARGMPGALPLLVAGLLRAAGVPVRLDSTRPALSGRPEGHRTPFRQASQTPVAAASLA